MLVSAASYCILWIAYLGGSRGDFYSGLALAFVMVLVSMVLIVTFAIMKSDIRGERGHKNKLHRHLYEWMERLKAGLVRMPFWALLHFFAVFLSVAFLFGFALAFHDRRVTNSLEQSSLGSAEVLKANGADKQAPAASSPTPCIDDSCEKPPLYKVALPFHDRARPEVNNDHEGTLCFYFREGRAELETIDRQKDETEYGKNQNVQREYKRQRANYESLHAIVDGIKAHAPSKLARVTLIGRANEKRIKEGSDPYLSNYELSEARTHDVWYNLSKELVQSHYSNWRNVEWIMLPLSNEQTQESPGRPICNEKDQDQAKVVEASVEYISNEPISMRLEKDRGSEFERLDLMGYMYFSIYTITTTGYGDVIPTTAYSKFLTSLANVFAIFFLVGFINALISLKGQTKQT